MCNKLFMRIKNVNSAQPRQMFIPCGKCEDCRSAMRTGWTFRLRVELDKLCEKGWKIGFFTLTYNNENLPYLPEEFFRDLDPFQPTPRVQCFRKSDIRGFFVKLKKFLHDNYDCRKVVNKVTKQVKQDTRIRYMVCSEFGEHTQRSHYHGIICFPPNVPERVLFEQVHKFWTYGFVFPRVFEGGYDSHGYQHKPFVCSSVKAAAVYASKYCCKDLAWYDIANQFELHKKVKPFQFGIDTDDELTDVGYQGEIMKLSDYKPFHYQSKSLGASFLDNLTDEEKLLYLKVGYHFVGDDRSQMLPLYIRNKILFTPKYIVDKESGKRLVRREARQFFRDNMDEIYHVNFVRYLDKYAKFLNPSYWQSLHIHPLEQRDLTEALKAVPNETPGTLAGFHLCWFGLPACECYDIKPTLQWYRRFDPEYIDVTNCPTVNSDYHQAVSYLLYVMNMLDAKYAFELNKKRKRDNREIARIHDYWKSQE